MIPSWNSLSIGFHRKLSAFLLALVIIQFFSAMLLLFPSYTRFGPFLRHQAPHQNYFIHKDVSALPVLNITTNVAAIIETRPLDNLVPLILHFSAVLGPKWPVILFTQNRVPISAPLRRAIDERRIDIRFLDPNIKFNDQNEVSHFLTSPWFWEQLAPAGHVLMFQADSMLCSASQRDVDMYLEYDFIGAPIDPERAGGGSTGYNGGLSLRNRSMTLDIIKRWSWREERGSFDEKIHDASIQFEDQWFIKKMKELPAHNDGRLAANLPSMEVAKTFSVESLWYEEPLGFHQIDRWHPMHIHEVDKWCPEWRMTTHDLLVEHDKV